MVCQKLFLAPTTDWPLFDTDYTDMVITRGHTFARTTCFPSGLRHQWATFREVR